MVRGFSRCGSLFINSRPIKSTYEEQLLRELWFSQCTSRETPFPRMGFRSPGIFLWTRFSFSRKNLRNTPRAPQNGLFTLLAWDREIGVVRARGKTCSRLKGKATPRKGLRVRQNEDFGLKIALDTLILTARANFLNALHQGSRFDKLVLTLV